MNPHGAPKTMRTGWCRRPRHGGPAVSGVWGNRIVVRVTCVGSSVSALTTSGSHEWDAPEAASDRRERETRDGRARGTTGVRTRFMRPL